MTPETKPNRQNPILQVLKRTVGFQAYERNGKEKVDYFPKDRFRQVGNNIVSGLVQFTLPICAEIIAKAGEEEPPVFRNNGTIATLTILLDMGVTIGTIVMAMNKIVEPKSVALGKLGYNLGIGALNELLERRKARKKQA